MCPTKMPLKARISPYKPWLAKYAAIIPQERLSQPSTTQALLALLVLAASLLGRHGQIRLGIYDWASTTGQIRVGQIRVVC